MSTRSLSDNLRSQLALKRVPPAKPLDFVDEIFNDTLEHDASVDRLQESCVVLGNAVIQAGKKGHDLIARNVETAPITHFAKLQTKEGDFDAVDVMYEAISNPQFNARRLAVRSVFNISDSVSVRNKLTSTEAYMIPMQNKLRSSGKNSSFPEEDEDLPSNLQLRKLIENTKCRLADHEDYDKAYLKRNEGTENDNMAKEEESLAKEYQAKMKQIQLKRSALAAKVTQLNEAQSKLEEEQRQRMEVELKKLKEEQRLREIEEAKKRQEDAIFAEKERERLKELALLKELEDDEKNKDKKKRAEESYEVLKEQFQRRTSIALALDSNQKALMEHENERHHTLLRSELARDLAYDSAQAQYRKEQNSRMNDSYKVVRSKKALLFSTVSKFEKVSQDARYVRVSETTITGIKNEYVPISAETLSSPNRICRKPGASNSNVELEHALSNSNGSLQLPSPIVRGSSRSDAKSSSSFNVATNKTHTIKPEDGSIITTIVTTITTTSVVKIGESSSDATVEENLNKNMYLNVENEDSTKKAPIKKEGMSSNPNSLRPNVEIPWKLIYSHSNSNYDDEYSLEMHAWLVTEFHRQFEEALGMLEEAVLDANRVAAEEDAARMKVLFDTERALHLERERANDAEEKLQAEQSKKLAAVLALQALQDANKIQNERELEEQLLREKNRLNANAELEAERSARLAALIEPKPIKAAPKKAAAKQSSADEIPITDAELFREDAEEHKRNAKEADSLAEAERLRRMEELSSAILSNEAERSKNKKLVKQVVTCVQQLHEIEQSEFSEETRLQVQRLSKWAADAEDHEQKRRLSDVQEKSIEEERERAMNMKLADTLTEQALRDYQRELLNAKLKEQADRDAAIAASIAAAEMSRQLELLRNEMNERDQAIAAEESKRVAAEKELAALHEKHRELEGLLADQDAERELNRVNARRLSDLERLNRMTAPEIKKVPIKKYSKQSSLDEPDFDYAKEDAEEHAAGAKIAIELAEKERTRRVSLVDESNSQNESNRTKNKRIIKELVTNIQEMIRSEYSEEVTEATRQWKVVSSIAYEMENQEQVRRVSESGDELAELRKRLEIESAKAVKLEEEEKLRRENLLKEQEEKDALNEERSRLIAIAAALAGQEAERDAAIKRNALEIELSEKEQKLAAEEAKRIALEKEMIALLERHRELEDALLKERLERELNQKLAAQALLDEQNDRIAPVIEKKAPKKVSAKQSSLDEPSQEELDAENDRLEESIKRQAITIAVKLAEGEQKRRVSDLVELGDDRQRELDAVHQATVIEKLRRSSQFLLGSTLVPGENNSFKLASVPLNIENVTKAHGGNLDVPIVASEAGVEQLISLRRASMGISSEEWAPVNASALAEEMAERVNQIKQGLDEDTRLSIEEVLKHKGADFDNNHIISSGVVLAVHSLRNDQNGNHRYFPELIAAQHSATTNIEFPDSNVDSRKNRSFSIREDDSSIFVDGDRRRLSVVKLDKSNAKSAAIIEEIDEYSPASKSKEIALKEAEFKAEVDAATARRHAKSSEQIECEIQGSIVSNRMAELEKNMADALLQQSLVAESALQYEILEEEEPQIGIVFYIPPNGDPENPVMMRMSVFAPLGVDEDYVLVPEPEKIVNEDEVYWDHVASQRGLVDSKTMELQREIARMFAQMASQAQVADEFIIQEDEPTVMITMALVDHDLVDSEDIYWVRVAVMPFPAYVAEFKETNAAEYASQMKLVQDAIDKISANNVVTFDETLAAALEEFIEVHFVPAPLYYGYEWFDGSFEHCSYVDGHRSLLFPILRLKDNFHTPVVSLIPCELISQRNEVSHLNFICDYQLRLLLEANSRLLFQQKDAVLRLMEQEAVEMEREIDGDPVIISVDITELVNSAASVQLEANSDHNSVMNNLCEDLFQPRILTRLFMLDDDFTGVPEIPIVSEAEKVEDELIAQRRIVSNKVGELLKSQTPVSSSDILREFDEVMASIRIEISPEEDNFKTDLFVGVRDSNVNLDVFESEEIARKLSVYPTFITSFVKKEDPKLPSEQKLNSTLISNLSNRVSVLERSKSSLEILQKSYETSVAEKLDPINAIKTRAKESVSEFGVLVEENARFSRDKFYLYFSGVSMHEFKVSKAEEKLFDLSFAKSKAANLKPIMIAAEAFPKHDDGLKLVISDEEKHLRKYMCFEKRDMENIISHVKKSRQIIKQRDEDSKKLIELEQSFASFDLKSQKEIDIKKKEIQALVAEIETLKSSIKQNEATISLLLLSSVVEKVVSKQDESIGQAQIQRSRYYETLRPEMKQKVVEFSNTTTGVIGNVDISHFKVNVDKKADSVWSLTAIDSKGNSLDVSKSSLVV